MKDKFALLQFMSRVATAHSVGDHAYVVGGAVRNFVAGWPVKDFDVAFDSVSVGMPGRDAEWFTKLLQKEIPARTSLVTNQYGIAILSVSSSWDVGGVDMRGEVIEVANARKESYGGEAGKGYKPHMVAPATIAEDLLRREFTFNTLMWRLGDLAGGPSGAEVLDLTGRGLQDLRDRIIRTPRDPDIAFSDDPTRMLRAVKFMARYGFSLHPEVRESVIRNARKLRSMPWDAVRKLLVDDVLGNPRPREALRTLQDLGLSDVLRDMMLEEDGFASAVGRELAKSSPLLAMDVHRAGWPCRTSVSYLSEPERGRLHEIVSDLDEVVGRSFNDVVRKPGIDQQRLFTIYSISPKERGTVVRLARSAILLEPSLAHDPVRLTAAVEAGLSAVYPRAEAVT